MSRRWQRKDLHPVPRAYALEHFSNAGRAGQRGGAADVRGSLATQDPPPAEECPLPLAGAGSAFPSLSCPAFYSLPSPSLFLSLCACVCLYLSPSLLPSFCLSPFLPHPQFFWSGGWEQQKQPAARAARRSLIRASWELGRGWGWQGWGGWRGSGDCKPPCEPQPQQFLGHVWDAASPGR